MVCVWWNFEMIDAAVECANPGTKIAGTQTNHLASSGRIRVQQGNVSVWTRDFWYNSPTTSTKGAIQVALAEDSHEQNRDLWSPTATDSIPGRLQGVRMPFLVIWLFLVVCRHYHRMALKPAHTACPIFFKLAVPPFCRIGVFLHFRGVR